MFQVSGERHLGVFVEVMNPGDSKAWSCNSQVELRIYNQREGTFFGQNFVHKFMPGSELIGFVDFKKWSELVHEDNGFLKVRCINNQV